MFFIILIFKMPFSWCCPVLCVLKLQVTQNVKWIYFSLLCTSKKYFYLYKNYAYLLINRKLDACKKITATFTLHRCYLFAFLILMQAKQLFMIYLANKILNLIINDDFRVHKAADSNFQLPVCSKEQFFLAMYTLSRFISIV